MPQQLLLLCGIAAFTFIASAFLCRFVREQLLRHDVLDRPNERSLHSQPCPRGGGIGIWLTVLPVWMLLGSQNSLLSQGALYLGAGLLIGISWLDDRKPQPALLRFAAQIVAVALGLSTLPPDHFLFGRELPFWADRAVAGFCWLWFINLTNFMDGIDGLSGVQTVHTSVGFAAAVLLFGLPLQAASSLAVAIAGAALGFLIWNWPKAKLFLGDVGSIPLGYLLGYFLLLLALYKQPGIALVLPLYYVSDATITLVKRVIEGKKFWHAHREHFYQKAAIVVGHTPVLYAVIAANAALLMCCFAAHLRHPSLLLLAPLIVGLLLWYLNRLSLKQAK